MLKKSSLAFLMTALLASVALPTIAVAPGVAAEEAAPAKAPTPPAIRVVAAEMRDIVEKLSVSGTIVAREEANAGTDLNGMIVNQLNADQGDVVKKGEILAVLDRSTLDTQLAQNEASRAQAEANIAQTQSQIADAEVSVRQASEALERAKTLQTKGFATKAELDNAVNASDSAKARLESAKRALFASQAQIAVVDAQKKSIDIQVDKTEVKAPADGLVLARNATLGGIVSSSGGPLFRLAIDDEFELSADVAETALPRLAEGMPSAISVAGWGAPVEGKIRLIGPEVNQALAARHDPHLAAVQPAPARRQFRPRRDRDRAPPRRRGAGFGGHLCRQRRLPAEGRGRPRQDRPGQARRARRRLCRGPERHFAKATKWCRAPAPSSPTATW